MDRQKSLDAVRAELNKTNASVKTFINGFVDDKSFVEMDTFAFTQNPIADGINGEGVVTGYATINDIPVYLFAQNHDVLKGGLGKVHADKIVKCMKMAYKTNAPFISVIDTAGARLGEGVTALEGYAEIINMASIMKGVVPMISVIKSECFGSMSFFAGINDFVYMLEDSRMAVNAPQVVASKSSNKLTTKQIGSAKAHASESGAASFVVKNVAEFKKSVTAVLDVFCGEQIGDETELSRTSSILGTTTDARIVIDEIFDKKSFIETKKDFATDMITGFARLGGITVAIIANNVKDGEEYLSSKGALKASKFVKLADCYNIPIVSLVNCKGTVPCITVEHGDIIENVSDLMQAVSNAEVGKLSIIFNKAIGLGYVALASKSTGFDYALSFSNAVVSTLDDKAGAAVVYSDEIAKAKDKNKAREKAEEKYAQMEGDPVNCAANGCIDNIIEASAARQYAISVVQMLLNKSEYL